MRVNRATSAVSFYSRTGQRLLEETPGERNLTPTKITGVPDASAYASQLGFYLQPDEGIYGLGQHRMQPGNGSMSYRGSTVVLEQQNREVAIPFLTSSLGYGVFWNNPAHTDVFVDTGNSQTIPSQQLFDDNGVQGGLTARYYSGDHFDKLIATRTDPEVNFNWTVPPADGLSTTFFSTRWTGSVKAQDSGSYNFVMTSDDGARLYIDDKLVIDDWTVHAATDDMATVHFAAGSKHKIRMEYFQDGGDAVAHLAWNHSVHHEVVWKSEAAQDIDYFFFAGPKLDGVISEFRHLTGEAPMPPKWALGYWQSKERYNTQQELLDIAKEYRDRHLPIDNIVQDWFYWDPYPWGSHQFDPKRYPDPQAAFKKLHDDYHMHLMISVWGKFMPGSAQYPDPNFDTMNAKGYLYPATSEASRYYDAFNPQARKLYWSFMLDQLFNKGIDAWWLDASEPEMDMKVLRTIKTGAGLGAFVLNAWPLMHTGGVYQGQLEAAPNKRVFILTRSAYAGQQRNAAATWSGDITGDWDTLRRQIPAGLDFCLSGIPYWTTDIGGFFVNYPEGSKNPEYRELFTRWFEWGAFCPIFRVHGTSTPKELWRFGPQYEPILAKYDSLRYRLMPYIYSQAWQVTHNSGTLMRALVMDFPKDSVARNSRDEFMFGPAVLVCPVTEKGATSRAVYLPAGSSWFDFWTGRSYAGGQTISARAPIQTLPLYVRSGSIVPMGPFVQYTGEKPADPIELRVYTGANGAFTLYEDDGITNAYKKGSSAKILFKWNDRLKTLTIGPRQGSFPTMLKNRTFHIVWVRPNHGTGIQPSPLGDQTVAYHGKRLVIHRT